MNSESQLLASQHQLLTEYRYKHNPIYRGYNNRLLYIDLDSMTVKEKQITPEIKEKFTGGRGFGLYYLWQAVTPQTKWNDPENEIVIAHGPLSGITQYPGAGKSLVCALSPLTHLPIDSNVGGYFGPFLKFSGFDALELQGKADNDVIIFIDGNEHEIRIETAPSEAIDSHILVEQLSDMYANNDDDKSSIAIVCSGTAAENCNIGMLNFSFWDKRRGCARLKQAGRGGIGRVFRDKHIKAIVCRYRGVNGDINNPAEKRLINTAGIRLHKEVANSDHLQNNMRKIGTANIIEVMDQYDLLPCYNYQFGSDPQTEKITSQVFIDNYVTQGVPDGCWYGCSLSCAKAVNNFLLRTGPYKGQRVCVDGPEYENAAGLGANTGTFDPDWILEANFYCDTYGLDTISMGTMTAFAMECFDRGIITLEHTGGLDLSWGNGESLCELMHQMSRGEGFGIIVGRGVREMKKIFVEEYGADKNFLEDIGMEQKGLEYSEYLMKESLAQQGGYALCNKGPQHDEAWLIFMDIVNNQMPTFEDKAEALYYFPLFRTWFGLLGMCKLPWNDITPADNKYSDDPAKVPGHVRNYCQVFEGVTGKSIAENDILKMSDRVYTFQRVFILRMGSGQRCHDKPPYRSLGPVTKEEYLSRENRYDKQLKEKTGIDPVAKSVEEKIAILRIWREQQFETLVDAVYKRRGWTPNGIPKLQKLEELGIDFPEVVAVVKPYLQAEGFWPDYAE